MLFDFNATVELKSLKKAQGFVSAPPNLQANQHAGAVAQH